MSPRAAATGAAIHNGWAQLVTLVARARSPVVIDRRRIELVAAGLPRQPHHHEALDLPLREAQELVDAVRTSAVSCAREALSTLEKDLESKVERCELALRRERPLPETLAELLASRPATMIADAEMYLGALATAATDLGIPVTRYARGEELELAACETSSDPESVAAFLQTAGKSIGPPWQKDHRLAAAAALGALARAQELAL